jgi:predicted SAM-dependent methyltransferase
LTQRFPPRLTSDGRALLNVGCGTRYHAAWTNVDLRSNSPDVLAYDIRTGLPYADKTFDAVYHSHVLEHMPRNAGEALIGECYRVLKNGGILRVVVPDLEFNARLYLQCLAEAKKENVSEIEREHYHWVLVNLIDQMVRTRSGGEMLQFLIKEPMHDFDFVVSHAGGTEIKMIRENYKVRKGATALSGLARIRGALAYRWHRLKRILGLRLLNITDNAAQEIAFRQQGEIHQWMYDAYSLGELLRKTGFSDVRVAAAVESAIANFTSFNLDTEPDGSTYKPGSLFMEARK